jgi:hypothetical protein
MRALLPKRVLEENTAIGVAAAYRHWYGGSGECQMLQAEHQTMVGRDYLRYRFLLRPDFAPEQWHVVEQTGFCRVKDGRITRIDVVCTGVHPVEQTKTGAVSTARAA